MKARFCGYVYAAALATVIGAATGAILIAFPIVATWLSSHM